MADAAFYRDANRADETDKRYHQRNDDRNRGDRNTTNHPECQQRAANAEEALHNGAKFCRLIAFAREHTQPSSPQGCSCFFQFRCLFEFVTSNCTLKSTIRKNEAVDSPGRISSENILRRTKNRFRMELSQRRARSHVIRNGNNRRTGFRFLHGEGIFDRLWLVGLLAATDKTPHSTNGEEG